MEAGVNKVANHKSADKRARQTVRRAARNQGIRSRVKTAVRAFRETLQSGDRDAAADQLQRATRELRKAASKGVMHTKTASRRVARLVLAYNSAAK